MISPNPMLRYLELEVTDVAHKPNIPSWMPRIKEVTGDPSHLNRELARR